MDVVGQSANSPSPRKNGSRPAAGDFCFGIDRGEWM